MLGRNQTGAGMGCTSVSIGFVVAQLFIWSFLASLAFSLPFGLGDDDGTTANDLILREGHECTSIPSLASTFPERARRGFSAHISHDFPDDIVEKNCTGLDSLVLDAEASPAPKGPFLFPHGRNSLDEQQSACRKNDCVGKLSVTRRLTPGMIAWSEKGGQVRGKPFTTKKKARKNEDSASAFILS